MYLYIHLATAGVDFLIEPDVLTFTSGQSAFDGLIRCANITILDDEVFAIEDL